MNALGHGWAGGSSGLQGGVVVVVEVEVGGAGAVRGRGVKTHVAWELLLAVRAAGIRDAELRNQGMRAAKSACLNCAEGAGRVSRADKARVFAIARAEAVEAAAAVEIAALCGEANNLETVLRIADRLVAMLTRLIR